MNQVDSDFFPYETVTFLLDFTCILGIRVTFTSLTFVCAFTISSVCTSIVVTDPYYLLKDYIKRLNIDDYCKLMCTAFSRVQVFHLHFGVLVYTW